MDILESFQQQVTQRGSDHYYSFLYCDDDLKKDLLLLTAFLHTLADIKINANDPQIAQVKYQFWQQEIAALGGQGSPQHPLSQGMQTLMGKYSLSPDLLVGYLEGQVTNSQYNAYNHFGEVVQHCHRESYIPALLQAKILDCQDDNVVKFAHDLGIAVALVDILQHLRRDTQRGCLYLAKEDLDKAGVSSQDNLASQENLTKVLEEYAKRAQGFYSQALNHLSDSKKARCLPFLIYAKLRFRLLELIQEDGFQVFQHELAIPAIRKWWLAFRCHHRFRL